jgi:hypothetical protein
LPSLYSSSEQEPLNIESAHISITSRPFDGYVYYTITQYNKFEGKQTIAVSLEECQELIYGLELAMGKRNKMPKQLQLFDPDNPPEAPSDPRLDSAH